MSKDNAASIRHDHEVSSNTEEQSCNAELELLRKVRLALGATLHMLECAQDDLVALGDRMDRLRIASERCRIALQEKKKRESSDSLEEAT